MEQNWMNKQADGVGAGVRGINPPFKVRKKGMKDVWTFALHITSSLILAFGITLEQTTNTIVKRNIDSKNICASNEVEIQDKFKEF
jgi:hypothetical protein